MNAVSTIFTLLLNGEVRQAYNKVNSESYFYVIEMAVNKVANNSIKLKHLANREKARTSFSTL